MNQKTGKKRASTAAPGVKRQRDPGGGSATAGGMNFQAAVTAIAGIHMLAGHALDWLDGIVDDKPLAVWSETGGAGDDLRLELSGGVVAEIQIKKGLTRGTHLWDALLSLARAVTSKSIHYGVLAVSGTSSGTITEELATDVHRIGEGRTDSVRDISSEFMDRLRKENLDPEHVCARLRVVTVHARVDDSAHVVSAKFMLSQLCGEHKGAAWDRLYREATFIPEKRGRWTLESLSRVLMAAGVRLSQDASAASAILARLVEWTAAGNDKFSIPATNVALSVRDAWIGLKMRHFPDWADHPNDLPQLLQRYRDTGERPSRHDGAPLFDAEWTAYFRPRAVVLAGPGMGKTTLMTRLAHRYAAEGYPVLKVSLKRVVVEMKNGKNFADSVFDLGLEGMPSSLANDVLHADLREWVILCDGLDETRAHQGELAEALVKFAAGYPLARIVVTSRPIGYTTGLLAEWSHYELLRWDDRDGIDNLCQLLRAADPAIKTVKEVQSRVADSLRGGEAVLDTLSTPQLLGMATGLICHGYQLGHTKVQIYKNYFSLLEKEMNARTGQIHEPRLLRNLVFDLICWEITLDPMACADDIQQRCAAALAPEFRGARLEAMDATVKCLAHWEQLGILETLHYGLNELIAASHQTFAEFGAARRLADMAPQQRAVAIERSLDDPAWVEVFRFAAGLGLANELVAALLARADASPSAIERALFILADNGADVSPHLQEALLERTKLLVQTPYHEDTYAIGLALGDVCRAMPVAEERFLPLQRSGQSWTRAIACLCALEAGRDGEILDEIELVLDRLDLPGGQAFQLKNPGPTRSQDTLVHDIEHRLRLGMVSRIVASRSRADAQAYLEALAANPTLSLRIAMDVAAYAEHKGFTVRSPWLDPEALMRRLSPPQKYVAAKRIEMNLLLRVAVSKRAAAQPQTHSPRRSLQYWRAFVQVTGLLESSGGDSLAWLELHSDVEAVEEVLKALLSLSGIDSGQLAADAEQVLNQPERDPYRWIPGMGLDIVPDWGLAPGLKINRPRLEAALAHPARWVVAAASNILAALPAVSLDRLTELWQQCHGYGFGGVAHLIKVFYPEAAGQTILTRLEGTVTPGLDLLLVALEDLGLPWSQRLDDVLNRLARAEDADLAARAKQFASRYVAQ